tara:strand:- start:24 stop:497 length:474 start_codon:yes stop_codon:yes gene_type:complete
VFSIGFPEFLLVTLAMLIFVGPERLPKVARWCGKMIARGQMMIRDIQRELEHNAELQDLKQTGLDIRKDITGAVQEFGKLSDEVTGDVKRLGESLSLDAAGGENSAPAVATSADSEPEEDFADEVELLRRSRRAAIESPDSEKLSETEPEDSERSNG